MKVVLEKESIFLYYNLFDMTSFDFYPKRNIKELKIVNKDMLKIILNKKIIRNINNTKKGIKLMLESNATLQSDCDLMINELKRILFLIDNKYKIYFNEFEYFELVNQIYQLNMEINFKKNLLE